jgi:hypothetical protein
MLPSGIATLLTAVLPVHPELTFWRIHVVPLSVDRHVSFLKSPPISTMLLSGINTLL